MEITKETTLLKVVTHLVKQGKPALESNGQSCVYYDEETKFRCAIGCLVPKKEYRKRMEGNVIRHLMFYKLVPPTLQKYLDVCGMDFLIEIQSMHDNSYTNEDFFIKTRLIEKVKITCEIYNINETTKTQCLELIEGMKDVTQS